MSTVSITDAESIKGKLWDYMQKNYGFVAEKKGLFSWFKGKLGFGIRRRIRNR